MDRDDPDASNRATTQCLWLLERIDALAAEAELETDLQRARQWRRERRELLRRAERLGCLTCTARAETQPQTN